MVVFAIEAARAPGKPRFVLSIIAVRDELGRIRFADYGGKLHNSVEKLIRGKGA